MKRVSDFDFSFQPSIDRTLIEELATGRFMSEGRNVIFQGPPGVGTMPGDGLCRAEGAPYFETSGSHPA
jgi:hypothetical protein